MHEVRIFCINLMRTRELALWQRLALLGTFCDTLSRECAAGRQDALPAMLAEFAGLVASGELLASLDQIQPDHGAQAMVFATLWAEKGFDTPSRFQQAVIRQISEKLGADAQGQVSADTLVAVYVRGLARLDEALADAPFLLENYLLNEIFSRLFPFNTQDAYDSFLVLGARFGLLRLLLAAQCSTEGALPAIPELLAAVHLHCRRFQHDGNYTARVHQSMRDSGWASLDKLVMLLRA
jgi:lysine-N-methylase